LRPQIFRGLVGLIVFGAAWFGLAGRVSWVQGWLCLVIFSTFVGLLSLRLAKINPDLMRERGKPGPGVEDWDRALMTIYTVGLIAQLALIALDSGRYRWSDVPLAVQLLGCVLLVGAGAAIWQVMMTNPFLSSAARLQPDRDQKVISQGLYAFIRHPMYLSVIGALIGLSLALGSWWSLPAAAVNAACYVYRTHREDLMLMRGLPGYPEYARSVRFRLLPGVW
jgi:protein-S-isoprenylcysteine O-methyltransferase Ste14